MQKIGQTKQGYQWVQALEQSGYSHDDIGVLMQAYANSDRSQVRDANVKMLYACALNADPEWQAKSLAEKLHHIGAIPAKVIRKALKELKRAA